MDQRLQNDQWKFVSILALTDLEVQLVLKYLMLLSNQIVIFQKQVIVNQLQHNQDYLWDDFSKYLSSRKILGGKLYKLTNTGKMKNFLKFSLSQTNQINDDRTALEERWSRIYQNNKSSKFYSVIKKNLNSITKSKLVLEYGCSIGIITSSLADCHDMVFGIDRSFSALRYAKKSSKNNLDYVVADSLSPVFGKLQFDLILALNILELVEPLDLLKHVSKQISSGYFVIFDPYDNR